MAPSPEYDKEPKAPDKSDTNNSTEEAKVPHNTVNELACPPDEKPSCSSINNENEDSKPVEALDDGQLQALLHEVYTYKCPKDREGKSSLFKELLEEVEQDEAAMEAAARGWGASAGARSRRHQRARRPLPHSNSLQDLVAAALLSEPVPRRRAPPAVSARTQHGGSLPCGVDTSFLLSEEPRLATAGVEYVATVRCENPTPLGERRVSTSDATPDDSRRGAAGGSSPLTYTARATLEIAPTKQVRSPSLQPPNKLQETPLLTPQKHQEPPFCANYKTKEMSRGSPSLGRQKHLPQNEGLPFCADYESTAHSSRGPPGRVDMTRRHKYQPQNKDRDPPFCANYETAQMSQGHPGLIVDRKKNQQNKDQDAPFYADYESTAHMTRGPPGLLVDRRLLCSPYFAAQPSRDASKKRFVDLHKTEIVGYDSASTFSSGNSKSANRSKMKNKSKKIPKNKYQEALKTTDSKYSQVENFTVKSCGSRQKHSALESFDEVKEKFENIVGQKFKVINPRNIRPMTIGQSALDIDEQSTKLNVTDKTDDKIYDIDCVGTKNEPPAVCNSNVTINNELPADDRDVPLTNCCKLDSKELMSKEIEIVSYINPSEENQNTGVEICVDEPTRAFLDDFSKCSLSRDDFESKSEPIEMTTVQRDNQMNVELVYMSKHDAKLQNKQDEISESQNINIDKISDKNGESLDDSIRDMSNDVDCDRKLNERELAVNDNYSEDNTEIIVRGASNVSDNAYFFLTLPKALLMPVNNIGNAAFKTDLRALLTSDDYDKASTSKESVTAQQIQRRNASDNKRPLRVILFEKVMRDGVKDETTNQVDSGIPFSCITTPEAVSSSNTTTSSTQPTVSIDNKGRGTTVTGGALPLPRPNYGTMSTVSTDEYKKSTDENGNSLTGSSSPPSGSSQNKKPRKKKSSKNETVIKSHLIDGYQGNKDLNEVLKFIESNEERGRGKQLRKHHDDDKSKKRSTDRRKDKDSRPQRASSLDERSRSTLDELTARPRVAPRSDVARRSWGDDVRDDADPRELTDFQTVTKKRRAKRRGDETVPNNDEPRLPPPSDKSCDSLEDSEWRRPASYADMVRTIPDLISSCSISGGPPDVVARPAVVLPGRATALPGVTFGFDVNRQLLARRPLRYVPPAHVPDCQLHHIVHYVHSAWEEIVKCGAKVKYFTE